MKFDDDQGKETEWWKKYYVDSNVKKFYEQHHKWHTVEQTQSEIDFVIKTLGISPTGSILDLCCGWGRHTIELAHRGYRSVGIDVSPFLLEKARVDADYNKVEVEFVEADMREIPFQAFFDACIVMYYSFGILDDEGNLATLKAIHKALGSNGRLLLDCYNLFFHLVRGDIRQLPARGWSRDGSNFILNEGDLDAINMISTSREIHIKNNSHLDFELCHRLYTYPELKKLLLETGFKVSALYGNYTGEVFEAKSEHLIIVADKLK